jgi:hypothetical protein
MKTTTAQAPFGASRRKREGTTDSVNGCPSAQADREMQLEDGRFSVALNGLMT